MKKILSRIKYQDGGESNSELKLMVAKSGLWISSKYSNLTTSTNAKQDCGWYCQARPSDDWWVHTWRDFNVIPFRKVLWVGGASGYTLGASGYVTLQL